MSKIQFEVQGSAAEPYIVTFEKRSETNLSAYCTCPAGDNGLYCKHRFSILEGNSKAIVSSNIDDVEIVVEWLTGTDVEAGIKQMRGLESESAKIKKELTRVKKDLAKAMRD